jgi:hypothetical protein
MITGARDGYWVLSYFANGMIGREFFETWDEAVARERFRNAQAHCNGAKIVAGLETMFQGGNR